MNCADTPVVAGCMLSRLLTGLQAQAFTDLRVQGLCMDSRELRAGDAFIALRGQRHDAAQFVDAAAAAGAVVVLFDASRHDASTFDAAPIPAVGVNGLGERLSEIADRFYGNPSVGLDVIGVTGTNGKTTCTQLVAQAFGLLDKPCGVIGTLGWGFPGRLEASTHTTPDAVSTQRQLASLREQGATRVAMEVSSHALKQGRTAAVRFASAVFTNLTHEHLDYHGSLEDYGQSKAQLFRDSGIRHAVLNLEDAFSHRIAAALDPHVHRIGYGVGVDLAEVRAIDPVFGDNGVRSGIVTPWGSGELRLSLLGRFNLSNALAVLSVLCLHGVELQQALQLMPALQAVPGRMQRIDGRGGPVVVVDYAHTPDALEQCLRALRAHCAGRLWCVFGCGGDRDRSKRPLMGRVAREHADELIVTSDNPRGEDPARIIEEIATGIPDPGLRREPDRAAAIAAAIALADPLDCVLIAGKGHETYQEANGRRVPFSDAEHARRALSLREACA